MKRRKEDLRVSILRNSFSRLSLVLIFSFGVLFNYSCSHKFVKIETIQSSKIITQTLKVKTFQNNETNKFTIYTQIDRENKKAILDGTGKFDKYVFHIEVNGNNYILKDYINHEDEAGELKDFDLVPLSEKDIFQEIDIKKTQPIIFESKDKNSWVEVYVKEQHQ